MPRFLNTIGRSTLGIGICDRCSRKFSLEDLHPDPNSPGLKVCLDDLDDYDPYRLPARETEDISLPFYRVDERLSNEERQPRGLESLLGEEEGDLIHTQGGERIRVTTIPAEDD